MHNQTYGGKGNFHKGNSLTIQEQGTYQRGLKYIAQGNPREESM